VEEVVHHFSGIHFRGGMFFQLGYFYWFFEGIGLILKKGVEKLMLDIEEGF
jgi:hypothetical protein